jgi:hypothetical protein
MTRDERMDPRRCTNDTQRSHLRFIEETGVSILSVAPRLSDDDPGPCWTYSIGLWQQYQHPEILIMGLDSEVAGRLINWFNVAIRDEARRFADGAARDDVLDGDYICYFEAIPHARFGDYFAGDRWFYDGNDQFEAVQMIWSDLNHRYPWDQAAPESFRTSQPIISSLPTLARN